MKLSPSSNNALDPLSNVLDVLGARVTRLTRMEAAGGWALAFPAIDRLKFVTLLRGSQWMTLPGREPQLLREGDACLIGRAEYVVASDPEMTPINGQTFYGANCDAARFGGDDTIGIGGSVTFSSSNADFLLDRLPQFLVVPRSSPASETIATILALASKEKEREIMGSEVVRARLADVLVVEAIRACAEFAEQADIGWLGAVSDLRLGRALRAIHEDVARPWTAAQLAKVAGMSRAAFSAEFTRRIGQPPLSYLRAWRLAIARAALKRDDATVAIVANKVGYASQSAFAHAFRRAFGRSPKAEARS
ncbi:MAG: AraC family transcriptional regulator [Deltaproteobacteria bacterium]|jgi:AraC-like DNA-binding protein|nr:AraC family transcriptional regulator [Deltaproteobacteria bacterium]